MGTPYLILIYCSASWNIYFIQQSISTKQWEFINNLETCRAETYKNKSDSWLFVWFGYIFENPFLRSFGRTNIVTLKRTLQLYIDRLTTTKCSANLLNLRTFWINWRPWGPTLVYAPYYLSLSLKNVPYIWVLDLSFVFVVAYFLFHATYCVGGCFKTGLWFIWTSRRTMYNVWRN